jgi:hypothetical protein
VDVRGIAQEYVDHALARAHREDPAAPRTGGPAGNARLTAWLGMVLLVGFAAEGITLLDVRGMVSWHIALGTILIPPALAKTATTGWRIVRYYTGAPAYRKGGPPPLLLRVLGPLVVASTLGVLGSGLAVATLRQPLLLGLHKATFVLWLGATGVHVLGRLLQALHLTGLGGGGPRGGEERIAGGRARLALLVLTAGVAVVGALLVISLVGPYTPLHHFR